LTGVGIHSGIGSRVRGHRLLRGAATPARWALRALRRYRDQSGRDVLARLATCADEVIVASKSFQGRFAISPKSVLFEYVLFDSYEPSIARMFQRVAESCGGDIVDVGANIGLYTVLAAKSSSSAKVLAIEPTEQALRRLKENISLNGVGDSVLVFEGVASDREGECQVQVSEGREEFSTMGELRIPGSLEVSTTTRTAPATTLDSLVRLHGLRPKLIKVDVEGAEELVFTGAETTIRDFRPIIFSELSDLVLEPMGSSAERVIDRLSGWGYDVRDAKDLQHAPRRGRFEGDIIAAPREIGISKALGI